MTVPLIIGTAGFHMRYLYCTHRVRSIVAPCKSIIPYTLTASLTTECNGTPTYEWNTGSTESSIQVVTTLPSYSVTITCGVCQVVVSTEGDIPECMVEAACTGLDICDNPYEGFYDEYCNCIPDSELPNYPNFNGAVDCSECDAEYKQISVNGNLICCDDPPILEYSETQVEKEVINFCYNFKETDIITRIRIKGMTLVAQNDNESVGKGYEDGNFFHFPYCMENNCSSYYIDENDDGINDIPSPFGLYDYKRLAYDLQRWAIYNGYEFTVSLNFKSGFCNGCDVGAYNLYVNNMIPSTTSLNNIFIYDQDLNSNIMSKCEAQIEGGYMVQFAEYDSDCSVTKLTVKTNEIGVPFEVENENGINLGDYKFGPVPHKGVGFRANITIACGEGEEKEICEYEIVTPDADCIVGDPCDSPNICASETYTTYNYIDCLCEVLTSNDADSDGVCDDEDMCPDSDDNLDNDNDGIPNCLDEVCGAEVCTYTLDLASEACSEPEGGCMNISNITIRIPDGTPNGIEKSLGKLPFFDESYDIGDACGGNQSDKLVKYIKRWFFDNGYVVEDVTVDDYVLTISGSNIEFLYVWNGCKDELEFTRVCMPPPICSYFVQYTHDFTTDPCIVLEDITFEWNGDPNYSMYEALSGMNFPYCFNYYSEACDDQGCTDLDQFVIDLESVYGLMAIVGIDGSMSESVLGITILNSEINFTAAVINKNPYIFDEINCQYPCDDGWDCTINDHYDEDCNCVGTYQDSDNDTVCDANDQCPGQSDLLDTNYNGTPDGCETVTVQCSSGEIPFCDYLANILAAGQECWNGRMEQNNLIHINEYLTDKLANNPEMLIYLPFPILKEQLENPLNYDEDNDGIVNILDPAPDKHVLDIPFGLLSEIEGWHNLDNNGVVEHINEYCTKAFDTGFDEEKYLTERALLLRTFMFDVNPGVFAGTNEDDSDPRYSPCFHDLEEELDLNGDYNQNGYLYSGTKGCYIYFEVDCNCDCIVKESNAISDEEACNPQVGDICTENPLLAETEGYHYVKCPPEEADPCAIYGIVANSNYDPLDPDNTENGPPCFCEQQVTEGGDPSATVDTDGDGFCDIIDVCPGENDDMDGDGEVDDMDSDGIPDCMDKCPETVIDPKYTKEGYGAPGGPGDVCDDGNPCTYDDVITLDCQCQGVYIDSDDDGVYDCEECGYEEKPTGSGMYQCAGCSGTVTVDAIGNLTDPGADDARTLRGCDVCPGIPDGDPEDIGGQYEGDLPMDYNDNGLPDCIDPPFKPVCPDEFEIANGVGLVLFFETDDLDEGDYPEPIKFQASISSTGILYNADYLTIDFVREVEDENGDKYTEIIYAHDAGDYITEDFLQAQIVYSDHQTCLLGAEDFLPLPCPNYISISGEVLKFESEYGNLDLSEILGTFIFADGVNTFEFEASNSTAQFYGNQLWLNPQGIAEIFQNPFSGTMTLPSGLVCNINGGSSSTCELEDGTEIIIGQPCDDGLICTHHDKYIDNGIGGCICVGELKPDQDNDGFCDAIDPCPEDWNETPVSGLAEDITDCPCPELELDGLVEVNPVLENGNDFVLYLSGDMSKYTSIVYTVENLSDPTETNELPLTSSIIISNLKPGFEYTITITAFCGQNEAGSLSYTVNVPFSDNPIICGVDMEKVDITSLTLLPSLSQGEDFQAADFTVNVKEVNGIYGKFSGSGYVSVPYFNQARLNVKFDNITVSADRQLVDGYVYVTGIGLALLGDDLSDAINGELDDIINTLEDASDLIDKIISVLEDIEKYLNSVKDLVTKDNLECYLIKKGILEGLIAQYQADNTSVTEEQLKQATADLKSCFNDASDDAIAAVAELMLLIEYSFSQFHSTCPGVEELENSLTQNGFNIDDSKEIIDNLFIDFTDLTSPSIVPLYSSDIAGIEFSKGVSANSSFAESDLMSNPLISSYYETEKELFLCNVSKLIVDDGIFDSTNPAYNQESANNMLNTIIIAVTNAGANMAKEFAPELLTGIKAEEIFNKDDNADKIKEMISDALANEVYK